MKKKITAFVRHTHQFGLKSAYRRTAEVICHGGMTPKGAYDSPAASSKAGQLPQDSLTNPTEHVRPPSILRAPGELSKTELHDSGLFDSDWYQRRYPDVTVSSFNPAEHFIAFGDALGRSPGPTFDAQAYLNRFPDLRRLRPPALRHYLRHGRAEKREISQVANSDFPATLDEQDIVHLRDSLGEFAAAAAWAGPSRETKRIELPFVRHDGGRLVDNPFRRVLLCSHVAARHIFGSERSFFDMVEGLSAIGCEVIAALPQGSAPAYIEALKPRVAAIVVLPYIWWTADTPEDEATIAAFCDVIARERIDVVHANTVMLREPLSAARRMGVARVIHIRELIRHDEALVKVIRASADDIDEAVHARADLLIANSRATRAAFTRPDSIAPALVYNTVDMEALAGVAPRPAGPRLRVGMISSNLPKKGLAAFATLAEQLRKSHPQISFCLIGPENKHTRILPRCVRILGYREDPAQAVGELDVVLSLSEFHESFGRAVLEAQAAGRPVVVWDRGAPPELVKADETGFVVPTDDMNALTKAVKRLAEDRELYDRMSEVARTHASTAFGPKNYAAQMKDAYDQLATRFKAGKLVLRARSDITARPRESLCIAYFCWHFPVPSETFVLNELRLLRAQGHDVRVFCKNSPHADFKPDFDIEWERVRDNDHLAQRLKETGRTICHAHFVYPTVTDMLWPACEKSGVPFTFIAHAQDIFRYQNDGRNRIGEIAQSLLCRKVFVPSRFHRAYLAERGVPEEKMMLNPNGCDYRLYSGGRTDDRAARRFRRVTAVHRFTEKKGLKHLIRAGKYLEQDGIAIDIYGYGELEQDYRQIIAAEGISNVTLHGPVEELKGLLEVFRDSDLFACPSVRAEDGDMDGIPTVLMEAMAAKLPVISTSISGIPDLVKDGVTGLVASAEPEAIAARIRAFYNLPDTAVVAMIDNAFACVRDNYDSDQLVDSMLRVWANESLDLMIVAWNNQPQITEIIDRLYRYTSLPFHLIVCDNGSAAPALANLITFYSEHDNMTLVLNRENAFVGPGTNICLAEANGEFAIYVCGKEGITTAPGWERSFVTTMRSDARIGLAGTLGYSPSYLHGGDYPENIPLFADFRNPDFASENSDRVFRHVQGGFFVLRRKMIDEIGGFSERVPHKYTDVEFSYYVESCGWKLGEVPGLMALFNKTRPGLLHRVDETHSALHPPMLDDLPALDRIAHAEVHHCNVCGCSSLQFIDPAGAALCMHCRADRRARSIFRSLAESVWLYRRLPALGIDLPQGIHHFWASQFQGKLMSSEEVMTSKNGSGFSDSRLALVGFGNGIGDTEVLEEALRVLQPDGRLLVAGATDLDETDRRTAALDLMPENRKNYASAVSLFDWTPILIYRRRADPK